MRWFALCLLSGCSAIVPGPDAGLPVSDAGLRLMTFNLANGAGDFYRTGSLRPQQAAFLSVADVIGLQEVDVDVLRSGSVNTAAAVSGLDCTPSPVSADGVLTCSAETGVVLFGQALRGDDLFNITDGGLPIGIGDLDTRLNPTNTDRDPSAMYGNALIVRGVAVDSAVVVALPLAVGPVDLDRYATLANGPLEELAAHNFTIRNATGVEPRSVLVARIPRPQRAPLAVLVVHLEAGDRAPLRQVQLSAALAIARGEQREGRVVAFLSDLNMQPSVAAPQFTDAGFLLVAGDGLDQIWAEPALTTSEAALLPTDGGSDHPFAPTVIVR